MNDRRKFYAGLVLDAGATGLTACGGDDGDESHGAGSGERERAVGEPADLGRFPHAQQRRSPGSRGAAPGAMPSARDTISGVEAFAAEMQLTPADAQRFARTRLFVDRPAVRGPRSAGSRASDLYETVQGAKQDLAHELRPRFIRSERRPGPSVLPRPGHPQRTRLDRLGAARRQRPVGRGSVHARSREPGPPVPSWALGGRAGDLSAHERGMPVGRSGGGGIRTHEGPNGPQRFSRPPRSTTPAPLRDESRV